MSQNYFAFDNTERVGVERLQLVSVPSTSAVTSSLDSINALGSLKAIPCNIVGSSSYNTNYGNNNDTAAANIFSVEQHETKVTSSTSFPYSTSPSSYNKSSANKEDPNEEKRKPKRPLSAYNIFFKEERGLILSEAPTRPEGKPRRSHGKIGFADLARKIAKKWKDLSAEERVKYNDMAVIDKERYNCEMEEWKSASDEFALHFADKVLSGKMNVIDKSQHQQQHTPLSLDTLMGNNSTDFSMLFTNLPKKNTLSFETNHSIQEAFQMDTNSCLKNNEVNFNVRDSGINCCIGNPEIEELALQLDNECIDYIITAFGNPVA